MGCFWLWYILLKFEKRHGICLSANYSDVFGPMDAKLGIVMLWTYPSNTGKKLDDRYLVTYP